MSFGKFENIGAFIRDCNNTLLRHDQACLLIDSSADVEFWSQTEECEGCILLKTADIPLKGAVVLDASSPLRYAVKYNNADLCKGNIVFVNCNALFT